MSPQHRAPRTIQRISVIAISAIIALGALVLAIWLVPSLLIAAELGSTPQISASDRLKAINDARGSIVTAVGALAVLSGSIVAYLNFRHTLDLNRRGQVTERFSRAVDQLGQSGPDRIDIRVGGIYALEQIARDSEDLYWPIIAVLTAFVSRRARYGDFMPDPFPEPDVELAADSSPPERARPDADIQAAFGVIATRAPERDQGRIDLGVTKLREVDAPNAQFALAALGGVDFVLARLDNANFQGAFLEKANFRVASLVGADFRRAFLPNSDFRMSMPVRADFREAEMRNADLRDAMLIDARFDSADLRGAKLKEEDLTNGVFSGARIEGAPYEELHSEGERQ